MNAEWGIIKKQRCFGGRSLAVACIEYSYSGFYNFESLYYNLVRDYYGF